MSCSRMQRGFKQGIRSLEEEKAIKEFVSCLFSTSILSRSDIERLKARVCANYKIDTFSNIAVLEWADKHKVLIPSHVKDLLRKRPVRSLSGIVNVSVLTKPYPCPASCAFCPLSLEFPKSYLPGEPAADRARSLGFDPYYQVWKRLEMLKKEGHDPSKIELRVIGGTWSYYPRYYQTWFIKKCFEAANNFPYEKKPRRTALLREQKRNEKASHRLVGISVETRPDYIDIKELKRLRFLGVTLVEMGVQILDNEVLKRNLVGTDTEIIARATQLLKDFGFKVLYQVMPQLPFSCLEKDRDALQRLWDPEFSPDWLKIYPCVAIEGTLAHKWFEQGRWRPYSLDDLISLLVDFKTKVPPWVRITRVFRDIPPQKIKGGVKILNLRELLSQKLQQEGKVCSCIRCREPRDKTEETELEIVERRYIASGGIEWFLSWEDRERRHLYSFVRLRKPSFLEEGKRPPWKVLDKAFLIREVQTFGRQLPVSQRLSGAWQHRGLAKTLLQKAEEIAFREGASKLVVISGVGVREYYRKLGYRLQDTYMVKRLRSAR